VSDPGNSSPAEVFDLTGRVAVITGAGGGIGRAAAVTLAGAGAAIVAVDVDRGLATETARQVVDHGGVATVEVVDVARKGAVDRLAEVVAEEHGRIDVWANVAAIRRRALLVETSEADLDDHIAVNLKGVYWGCAAAGRVMAVARRGSIINVASAGGEVASPGSGAYGVTKAAVIHLTRVVAAELGPHGVRANCVAPGFVETSMTARDWTRADGTTDESARAALIEQVAGMVPLRRVGTALDIAYALLYLASDASAFMTGQVLRPNGGNPMH
jgi:3-oxoacyl-[acyl-carrier protein] reductase